LSSRKKIAFIKRGPFSHINANVGKTLAEQFPGHELHTIDLVDDILRRHKLVVAVNLLLTLARYGWGIARGYRELRDYFYRTPFIFRRIKALIAREFAGRKSDYAFSLQTQSLYDAAIPGVPHFVYSDHTHLANLYYPGFARKRLCSPRWIALEKTIYQRATKTFVMSRQVAQSVVEHYGCAPEKVTCIYGGYNFEMKPLPLRNDSYRNKQVLFVGVDWERKGGPDLVAAFKLVREKIPDARLAIVGASPRLDIANCEIAGRVPLERVQDCFVQSSVFCLPSKVEPFGIVCIEAFMNRIPVVATRINALADMVEDGKSGRLVSPGNVSELAAALIELLSDPGKCRRFGERGYETVIARYSWKAVGQRMRTEIDAALGSMAQVSPSVEQAPHVGCVGSVEDHDHG
jgi:glycosyltransferase involved in cell wall biosynthesis